MDWVLVFSLSDPFLLMLVSLVTDFVRLSLIGLDVFVLVILFFVSILVALFSIFVLLMVELSQLMRS